MVQAVVEHPVKDIQHVILENLMVKGMQQVGQAPIINQAGETSQPGTSDYTEGSGEGSNESSSLASGWSAGLGGGGYGGGAGGNASGKSTKGGDGTVLIRYYAYEE